MKKIKNIFESIKLKWLRDTGLTILLVVIIVAAFIGINIGVEALNLTDIDLTSEKLYTLTDESKKIIAEIPAEDKIEIYLFDYPENSSVVDLVKQYVKVNENISMEVTTVSDRKDIASKYNVLDGAYTILVVCGEKYKMFTNYDLYVVDYNTQTSTDITEQRFTNSIVAVSSIGKTTPIYVLKGHNEYGINTHLTTLKTYLELENYELKELDLLVEEKVPDDCTAIIVASPQKDFTELEANKLKDYINRGGNILWMNDPFSSEDATPNIQSVLDLYGVTIDIKGITLEQDTSKMVMSTPDLIIPTIQPSDLAAELSSEGTVLLLDSAKLNFVDSEKLEELGVTKTDLLTTSDKSFFRRDTSIASFSPQEGEEVGSKVVGAALEKKINDETTSKLIVYANNLFATDYPMQVASQEVPSITLYNNLDLVINSVSYIAEIEDQITVRKSIDMTTYTATETQNRVVMTIIFGVPVVIILLGIVVWQLRRRKK